MEGLTESWRVIVFRLDPLPAARTRGQTAHTPESQASGASRFALCTFRHVLSTSTGPPRPCPAEVDVKSTRMMLSSQTCVTWVANLPMRPLPFSSYRARTSGALNLLGRHILVRLIGIACCPCAWDRMRCEEHARYRDIVGSGGQLFGKGWESWEDRAGWSATLPFHRRLRDSANGALLPSPTAARSEDQRTGDTSFGTCG